MKQLRSLNLPISLTVSGLSAIILFWYFKQTKIKYDNLYEILWTNGTYQCKKTEHKFEECDEYCGTIRILKMKRLIDQAKYSIDIAMHILTLTDIYPCLIEANKRGVKIRIILCTSQRYSTNSQSLPLFENGNEYVSKHTKFAGIEVHSKIRAGDSVMHHKFCIIDGVNNTRNVLTKRNWIKNLIYIEPNNLKPILLAGSCNWTKQGLFDNWENIIITNNETLLNEFEKEFELLWQEYETDSAINLKKKK